MNLSQKIANHNCSTIKMHLNLRFRSKCHHPNNNSSTKDMKTIRQLWVGSHPSLSQASTMEVYRPSTWMEWCRKLELSANRTQIKIWWTQPLKSTLISSHPRLISNSISLKMSRLHFSTCTSNWSTRTSIIWRISVELVSPTHKELGADLHQRCQWVSREAKWSLQADNNIKSQIKDNPT